MGARIRAHDWQHSPLGIAPEYWPRGLRTAMRVMLTTQHPVFIFWGEQHFCFYNDAYSRSLGTEKHPSILGQPGKPSWSEIWPIIGPQINQVLRGEGATWHENQLVPIMRHGELQDVYWTYSFGPIDEPSANNGIGGVLVICTETTQQMLAEQRMYSERERFQQLFEQAPTFMAVLRGPRHVFEFANPGYMRLIDHRPVSGLSVAEALPEVVSQGYIELLDQVYASGEAFSANGAKFVPQAEPGITNNDHYIDFVYQPIKNNAGEVWGIFVEGADVTDRVLAENRHTALIRLTDEIRHLKTPDDITFRAARILGETLEVSRVGYGTIDPVAGTLVAQSDWTAPGIPSLAGTVNLRDYDAFIDDLRAGNFIAIDDVAQDARTQQTATALIERNARAFVSVPLLDNGKLVAVLYLNHADSREWAPEEVAFIREFADRIWSVRERLRTELALRESEAKFRTIADAMPQMVWSTLPDGHHDYYNQQWYDFTGVPLGSTDGEKWNGLFHPDDRRHSREAWQRSLATGEPYEVQYRLRHHSGIYRWTLGRALPVRGEAGNIIRWMGTCTDIHSQKLAEEELRESSLRKDEFLAMLAHELRNPLAPISTAAQLLSVARRDEKLVGNASAIISRQVRHMTDLVDDLLDVSRVSRGLVQLVMEKVDIKNAISDAVEQARPLIEKRRHGLKLSIGSQPAFVKGDHTRLVQVFANLLNNAAKYTPPGGEIELVVMADTTEVTISVTDNGSGMTAALLPHVFDLFRQGERTPDRAQGGLGLGLALVKSITASHGGQVTAFSAGPGAGSVFTISLPVLQKAAHRTSSAGEAATLGACPRPVRMMIVDDNSDAAASLAALLEFAGHQVVVREDAESALQAAIDYAADVFILDIGLPGMNGHELARRLRANPASADAIIIALTGYGQQHDRLQSTAAGFDHHLVKPIDTRQLDDILAQVHTSASARSADRR